MVLSHDGSRLAVRDGSALTVWDTASEPCSALTKGGSLTRPLPEPIKPCFFLATIDGFSRGEQGRRVPA